MDYGIIEFIESCRVMKKTYIIALQNYGDEKNIIEETLLNHISSKSDSFGFTTDAKNDTLRQLSDFLIERNDIDVSIINEEDDAELTNLKAQEKWSAYKFKLTSKSLALLKSSKSNNDFFFYQDKQAFAKKGMESYEVLLSEEEADQVRDELMSTGLREEDFFKL